MTFFILYKHLFKDLISNDFTWREWNLTLSVQLQFIFHIFQTPILEVGSKSSTAPNAHSMGLSSQSL